ncbi:MAG: hypothetical protein NC211_02745 [Alistipes senegalensis]|nr:hypothetical protein [Oxalobacter formigenes]MCM1280742.1 hypothetical protein [Alistipes senegalensis]
MLELKTAWFNGQPIRYIQTRGLNRKKRNIWFYDADILALLALNKSALADIPSDFTSAATVNMEGIGKQLAVKQQIGIISAFGVVQLCAHSAAQNAAEFAVWIAKGGIA